MADNQDIWSMEVTPEGVIKLQGEIDFAVTPKVRTALLNHVRESEGDMLFDLSELTYLDSAGLALFIELRRVLQDEQRSVVITQIHPQVKKLFNLTQVGHLFGLSA